MAEVAEKPSGEPREALVSASIGTFRRLPELSVRESVCFP